MSRSVQNAQEDDLVQERGNEQEHISKRLDFAFVLNVERDDQRGSCYGSEARGDVIVVAFPVLPQSVRREKRERPH